MVMVNHTDRYQGISCLFKSDDNSVSYLVRARD